MIFMKKSIVLIIFISYVFVTKAQISTCCYLNGYWGEWKSHTTRYGFGIPNTNEYNLYGGYSGFIIYKKGTHPSEYIFKFQAYAYSTPDKKTIKEHRKNNVWYEYPGIVEYYVTEDFPTIDGILKVWQFPQFNCNSGSIGNPCVKRVAAAKIKIAPYKKRPQVYNIWFDDVGVAIDMEDSYFNQ